MALSSQTIRSLVAPRRKNLGTRWESTSVLGCRYSAQTSFISSFAHNAHSSDREKLRVRARLRLCFRPIHFVRRDCVRNINALMFPALIFGSNKNPGAREILRHNGALRINMEIIQQLTGDKSVPCCEPGLPRSRFVRARRVPPIFFEPILECFIFRHTCFSISCATFRKSDGKPLLISRLVV